MNVKQIDGKPVTGLEAGDLTHEQLKNELSYERAVKLTDMLYKSGRLTEKEYVLMIKKLREKFPPLYVSVLPEITCYLGPSE